jgi:23S rRNA G2069 N7-methylase RlmK/C1962 C5-methylase RlmI
MRRPQRTFVLEQDLSALLTGAIDLLDPGGILLLATNCRQISASRMEQGIRAATGNRGCAILDRPDLPPDFPGDPDYAKSIIVQMD